MNCPNCNTIMVKNGSSRGKRRLKCPNCGKTKAATPEKVGRKIIPRALKIKCKICGKPARYPTERLCAYHYNKVHYFNKEA